jgi:osmotically-inducible protein OsmY
MASTAVTQRIEKALVQDAELHLAVEEDEGRVVVSGMVSTENEHDTALDIVTSLAGAKPIDDNIEVEGAMPEYLGKLHLAPGDFEGFTGGEPGLEEAGGLEPGDFGDQDLATDPFAGSGAGPSSSEPDDAAEGNVAYVPPVDPVGGSRRVIGGYEITSLDDQPETERSTFDGRMGDDEIATAVLRELKEDAATSDLDVHVTVRNGVVHLRGSVPTIDDAENTETVASRVAGVARVTEMLDVTGGRMR